MTFYLTRRGRGSIPIHRCGPIAPEDAGFSKIGQWLAAAMDDAMRKGLWRLYLLFAAQVGVALELHRRLATKKKPGQEKPWGVTSATHSG